MRRVVFAAVAGCLAIALGACHHRPPNVNTKDSDDRATALVLLPAADGKTCKVLALNQHSGREGHKVYWYVYNLCGDVTSGLFELRFDDDDVPSKKGSSPQLSVDLKDVTFERPGRLRIDLPAAVDLPNVGKHSCIETKNSPDAHCYDYHLYLNKTQLADPRLKIDP